MANEGLQYDISINFSDYEQSLQKILSSTVKANTKLSKSYNQVDEAVKDLTTDMQHSASKVGKSFSLGSSQISSETKRIVKDVRDGKISISKGFEQIEKSTDKLNKSFKGLGRTTKAGFTAIKKGGTEAKKTATSVKNLDDRSAKLSKTVKTLAGAYLGFASARKLLRASFQLGGKILDESGQLETATEKWRIFKGSAEEAKDTIKDLFEFSNRTPFTFKDVNNAATQLYVLTDGALQGSEALEQMGNRAAMAKVPMSQLTTWWGRLYAGMQSGKPIGRALTRMQQLGIISGKLRNELDGLSKEDMMSGKGWEMFIEGTGKADGMIADLAKTIEGKKSTLSGVWDGLFALEGENLDSAKDQLDNIIKALNDNKGLIQDFFSFSLEVFSTSVNGAMKLLKGYMSYVDKARNTLGGAEEGGKLVELGKKYQGQSSVSLARTDSSLAIQRKAVLGDISILRKSMIENLGAEEAKRIEQKAIKGEFGATGASSILNTFDMMGKTGKYAGKMTNLQNKLSGIVNERIALNQVLKDQEKTTIKTGIVSGLTGFTGGEASAGNGSINLPLVKGNLFGYKGGSMLSADRYDRRIRDDMYEDISRSLVGGQGDMLEIDKVINDLSLSLIESDAEYHEQMLAQNQKFYSDSISILGDSNSTIIGLHEALTSGTASGVLGGLSGGASGLSGILGTLGLVDPSGISGILGGVLGIGSTIAGFFESDDSNDIASDPISSGTSASTSSRTQIVSSGPENVYQTNNFNLNGCIVDEATFTETVDNEISPRLSSATKGVLTS